MKTDQALEISICEQTLKQFENGKLLNTYSVSTALNGAGELLDSECTPRGKHLIAEKIGAGEKINTVFVGRKPTGEIFQTELREQYPNRDWILTRILWLSGLEVNRNQGGKVDSHDRYIYIHGTPDDVKMGIPGSRGCIRMRNHEIIELFDWVDTGCPVEILE